MAKTFWISWEDEGSESSFQLSVLPELSAADLSCCVRDRLGLVPSVPFYLTEESRKTGPALPLSPALPDGSRLRLVLPMGKSPFPAPGVAPAAPASAGGTAPAAAAADTQNCCVAEPGDPKQISTDLANERTLLAWLRTGLAAIRTVFSFATLSGLTKGELLLDVVVTLILSFSGLATLTVGWKRFQAVRTGSLRQRLAIGPLYSAFIIVAAVCLLGTLWRQPKRFAKEDGPEILAA